MNLRAYLRRRLIPEDYQKVRALEEYFPGLLFGSVLMYAGMRGTLLMESYSFGLISADLGTIYAYAFGLATAVTFVGGLLYTGWVSKNFYVRYTRGIDHGQLQFYQQTEYPEGIRGLSWKEDLAIALLWIGTPIILGVTFENLIVPLLAAL